MKLAITALDAVARERLLDEIEIRSGIGIEELRVEVDRVDCAILDGLASGPRLWDLARAARRALEAREAKLEANRIALERARTATDGRLLRAIARLGDDALKAFHLFGLPRPRGD